MRAKNSLAAADAKIVEERFQAKLSAIGVERRPVPQFAARPTIF
jgi:hypothetical protein